MRQRGRRAIGGPWRAAAAALLVAAALAGAARAAEPQGAWSALADWPLIPIHAVLTTDGRILSYGTTAEGRQTGLFTYDVWDPAQGLRGGHLTLPNGTGTDIFCSAQLILPGTDRVFLAGGDVFANGGTTNRGTRDTTEFRAGSSTLVRGRAMNRPRWYATTTTLPGGEIYIQGGRDGEDRPEVRQLDGTFRLLDRVDTTPIYWWYPRNFVAPDGRVFGVTSRAMYYVDPNGAGMLSGMGVMDRHPGGITSSEVMYRPGKILVTGGGSMQLGGPIPGSVNASIVDINGPQPRVTATQPLPQGLHWHNATVLPDGRVVVTGGSTTNGVRTDANYTALLWDPATGAWTRDAVTTSRRARLYHSIGILLPDGSVLVGGGGAPGPQVNTNAELYYPPYLFDADGRRKPRPAITRAPAQAAPGDSIMLAVDDAAAIARVTLIKTGSVTHSFNMEQRFTELRFSRSGHRLQVTLPKNPARLPPGMYLIFVLNRDGTPSIGRQIAITAGDKTAIAATYTPSLGAGFGGEPYRADCPAGTALVGLRGGSGDGLRWLAPRCVALAGQRWSGRVIKRPRVGSRGGETFERLCPVNTVVSGISGKAGGKVEEIRLECRPLGADGRLRGQTIRLDPAGDGGGTGYGPLRCSTGFPAASIYGLAGGERLNTLGLACRKPG